MTCLLPHPRYVSPIYSPSSILYFRIYRLFYIFMSFMFISSNLCMSCFSLLYIIIVVVLCLSLFFFVFI